MHETAREHYSYTYPERWFVYMSLEELGFPQAMHKCRQFIRDRSHLGFGKFSWCDPNFAPSTYDDLGWCRSKNHRRDSLVRFGRLWLRCLVLIVHLRSIKYPIVNHDEQKSCWRPRVRPDVEEKTHCFPISVYQTWRSSRVFVPPKNQKWFSNLIQSLVWPYT